MPTRPYTRAQAKLDKSSPPKPTTRSSTRATPSSPATTPKKRKTRSSGTPRAKPAPKRQQTPKAKQALKVTQILESQKTPKARRTRKQADTPKGAVEGRAEVLTDAALEALDCLSPLTTLSASESMPPAPARLRRLQTPLDLIGAAEGAALTSPPGAPRKSMGPPLTRTGRVEERTRSPTPTPRGEILSRQLSLLSVSTNAEDDTQRSLALFDPQEAGTGIGIGEEESQESNATEVVGHPPLDEEGRFVLDALGLAVVHEHEQEIYNRARGWLVRENGGPWRFSPRGSADVEMLERVPVRTRRADVVMCTGTMVCGMDGCSTMRAALRSVERPHVPRLEGFYVAPS